MVSTPTRLMPRCRGMALQQHFPNSLATHPLFKVRFAELVFPGTHFGNPGLDGYINNHCHP